MSENEDQAGSAGDESLPRTLDIGATLTSARKELDLSVEEAAQQLRLSPRQLYALEANDYSGLPGPTFIRGFVRNYSRLLKLDPEPLLRALEVQAIDSMRHAISLHSEDIAINRHHKRPWQPYAIATAMVGLVLGGWLIYMDYHESHPEQKISSVPVTEQEKTTAGGYDPKSDNTSSSTLSDVSPASIAVPSQPTLGQMDEAKLSSVQLVKAEPAVTGSARLKFVFNQQSWVRIIDRDGKEIFHKNGPAGTEDMTEGMLPLKVEIGNAAGVQITFNDNPVNLAPHTRANVARFTLE